MVLISNDDKPILKTVSAISTTFLYRPKKAGLKAGFSALIV